MHHRLDGTAAGEPALGVIEPTAQEGGSELIVCTGGARVPAAGLREHQRLRAHARGARDPKGEEHDDGKRWVGRGYDPERLTLAAVNKKLATLSKRLGRRRK
jgi:hypothetical protein